MVSTRRAMISVVPTGVFRGEPPQGFLHGRLVVGIGGASEGCQDDPALW
jgi:hypothetical protein